MEVVPSSVVVDIKSGVAFLFGEREEMQQHIESIRSRCRVYQCESDVDSFIRLVDKQELGAGEMEYMMARNRIPKRLMMRLKGDVK
jgi:hypothetical protein